jgi:uncharacterized membrane protein
LGSSAQEGQELRVYYHHIAGHSLERLSALSDGIFAVALTLLVLDLRAPASQALHVAAQVQPLWAGGWTGSEQVLWNALVRLGPNLLAYLISFLTLGMFWVGHQTQLNHLARSNRHLTWINLAFLLGVALMPFSTALLSAFMTFRIALVVYWLNLLYLGLLLLFSWRYAQHAGLIKEDTPAELRGAIERRIVVVQAVCAFAVLLCVINTYVSICLIILLQLNSAIAPRIFPLDRF